MSDGVQQLGDLLLLGQLSNTLFLVILFSFIMYGNSRLIFLETEGELLAPLEVRILWV